MSKPNVHILGTGSYAPETVLSNADLMGMVDTTDEWITTRTGIKERRVAGPGVATSDIATPAAKSALDAAGLDVMDVDLILLGTATPDMLFPSTACVVQSNLGARNAAAFDLSAACSGFLYAVSVGKAFIESGTYKNALVIGAEALTNILNWEDRTTCVLFGDGAGAVVLGRADENDTKRAGILAIHLYSDGDLANLLYMPAGGSRIPTSPDSIEKKLHFVKMEGREVFKHAVKHMSLAMEETLAEAGFTPADLDLLVPHQANLRIMEAVAKRLEIPNEKVFVNVDRYGNTSAASVPIALDEAVRSGRIKPGDLVGTVVFGGGFTWAAAVVQF